MLFSQNIDRTTFNLNRIPRNVEIEEKKGQNFYGVFCHRFFFLRITTPEHSLRHLSATRKWQQNQLLWTTSAANTFWNGTKFSSAIPTFIDFWTTPSYFAPEISWNDAVFSMQQQLCASFQMKRKIQQRNRSHKLHYGLPTSQHTFHSKKNSFESLELHFSAEISHVFKVIQITQVFLFAEEVQFYYYNSWCVYHR